MFGRGGLACGLAAMALLGVAGTAGATTADNVACAACVDATDLAFGNLDNGAEDATFDRVALPATTAWPTRLGSPAWSVVSGGSNCFSGTVCATRAGNGTGSAAQLYNAAIVDASPGDGFVVSGYVKGGDSSTNGAGGVELDFFNSSGTMIKTVTATAAATTSYVKRSAVGTAPAGTVAARAAFAVINHGMGVWWADNMTFRRQITRASFDPSVDREYAEAPGFGLLKTAVGLGSQETFSVNTAQVQQRVSASCPAGQAIRAVAQNGTVTCEVAGTAYYAFRDADHQVCNSTPPGCTEATMSLPAGTYAIFSKEHFDQSSEADYQVACQLNAGADSDSGTSFIPATGSGVGVHIDMERQVVHTFTAAGSVALVCSDYNVGDVHGNTIKITAIKLSSQSRTVLP